MELFVSGEQGEAVLNTDTNALPESSILIAT